MAGKRTPRILEGRTPQEVFACEEVDALLPLPVMPFELASRSTPKVAPDAHVKVGRCLYSVPYRLIGQRLDARATGQVVQLFYRGELVKTHPVARRIKAAHFPTQATLEGFDFSYNKAVPAATIRDLARLGFIEAGEGILIYGPVGVGKSHIAIALGHLAARRGHEVIFTASRLLAELAGGHTDRSFEARLKRLARPAMLIVDDRAMREFTANQADDVFELLGERLDRPGRSLALTSNRSPADWYPLFPNAVVGESILDRVLNSSHHLLLEGKSYRPAKRPRRTDP